MGRRRRSPTTTRRPLHLGTVTVLLLLFAGAHPRAAAAWQGDAPRSACLQGDPLPSCSSFWIIEMQASTTLTEPIWTESSFAGGRARATADRKLVEWNLGHMWNRSEAWALGGTVSVGNNARGLFTGARVRARRWLNPSFSVSLETGLARSTARPNRFDTGIGPSVGLRFDSGDYLSAFVRYDRIEAIPVSSRDPQFSWSPNHEYVRVGVGLGGKAALVGTGAVAVGVAVLLAILANSLT